MSSENVDKKYLSVEGKEYVYRRYGGNVYLYPVNGEGRGFFGEMSADGISENLRRCEYVSVPATISTKETVVMEYTVKVPIVKGMPETGWEILNSEIGTEGTVFAEFVAESEQVIECINTLHEEVVDYEEWPDETNQVTTKEKLEREGATMPARGAEATADPIWLFRVKVRREIGDEVCEYWDTKAVFFSREDGEEYGEKHSYKYGEKNVDWQVYAESLWDKEKPRNLLRAILKERE